jgi:hypothetical protein
VLAVDATGVGKPVVDLLRERGLAPMAVTITGGDTVTGDARARRVPKSICWARRWWRYRANDCG